MAMAMDIAQEITTPPDPSDFRCSGGVLTAALRMAMAMEIAQEITTPLDPSDFRRSGGVLTAALRMVGIFRR